MWHKENFWVGSGIKVQQRDHFQGGISRLYAGLYADSQNVKMNEGEGTSLILLKDDAY